MFFVSGSSPSSEDLDIECPVIQFLFYSLWVGFGNI